MTDHLKFLRKQAAKGGKAGKGKSKVRGDSQYYRKLAKKRGLSPRAANTNAVSVPNK